MSKGNSPPKTIVLELRERSGTNAGSSSASNGDFTVNLAKPVTMEAGDQLALKSVFVDSVQTSQGDVVLMKDVPASIVSGLYSCNFQTTDKQYNRGEASNAVQPDCKNYVHCRTQGQATNAKAMMSLTFHAITTNPFSKAGADAWGNIHVSFDYTPLGGTLGQHTSRFTCFIPGLGVGDHRSYTLDLEDAPIVFLTTSGVDSTADWIRTTADSHMLAYSVHTDVTQSRVTYTADSVVAPLLTTQNFTVPKGQYKPDEIARFVSDKMSLCTGSGALTTFPINSPYLTTFNQYKAKYPNDANHDMASVDGSDLMRFIANDYYIGTPQIGFEFDNDFNKFKFTTINQSIYDSGNISLKFVQTGGAGNNYFIANKSGGCFFNKLEPASFWFDTLGLSPTIQANVGSRKVTLNPALPNFSMPVLDLKDGVNTTGSYTGLDIAVNKNNALQVPADVGSIVSTSLAQVPIYATQTFSSAKEGYFKIEIGGIEQSLIGSATYSSKVQAIIGRYYQSNSFTQAYNEGSISYTHFGEPQMISAFRVRILNGENVISAGLGGNSTVFLELTKAASSAD